MGTLVISDNLTLLIFTVGLIICLYDIIKQPPTTHPYNIVLFLVMISTLISASLLIGRCFHCW